MKGLAPPSGRDLFAAGGWRRRSRVRVVGERLRPGRQWTSAGRVAPLHVPPGGAVQPRRPVRGAAPRGPPV